MPKSRTGPDLTSYHLLTEVMDVKTKMYVDSRAMGSLPVVAARISGFRNPDVACTKLEADITVRTAIEAAIRQEAHKLQLTKVDVINGMMDAVHMASSASELVSAWREIGRLINAYTPEAEKEIKHVREDLAQLSDAELAKRASLEGNYQVLEFTPVGNDKTAAPKSSAKTDV